MSKRLITPITGLVMTISVGCGTSDVSNGNRTEADWKSVALHIDGFKKSKSGAT